MPPFLEAVSAKITDRWLSLVLPGFPLVGAVLASAVLGHRHGLDIARLTGADERWATRLATLPGTTIALLAIAAMLAAGAAGVVARAAGGLLRAVWTRPWLRGADRLTARRRDRWLRLQEEYEREVLARHHGDLADTNRMQAIGRRRNRIALAEPSRPTWMGDRLAAMEARVLAEYSVDLAAAWPRLWLLLAEDGRTPIRQAFTALDTAATIAGWGVLYLAVGVVWWPAAILGAAVILTGWWRARQAVDAYADLTESTVDLYFSDLAQRFGLAAGDVRDVGPDLSARFRKGA